MNDEEQLKKLGHEKDEYLEMREQVIKRLLLVEHWIEINEMAQQAIKERIKEDERTNQNF